LKNIANDDLVAEIKYRINNLGIDYLISSGQLEQLIQDTNSSLPQLISSERPDKVAAYILEGRVAILVNRYSLRPCCPCCSYWFSYISWGCKFKIPIFRFIKAYKNTRTVCYITFARALHCNYHISSRAYSNRVFIYNSGIKK